MMSFVKNLKAIMLENGGNVRCKCASSLSSDLLLIIDVRRKQSTFQSGSGSVIAVFHLSLTADCGSNRHNRQYSYANSLMVLCHPNPFATSEDSVGVGREFYRGAARSLHNLG